MLLTAGRFINTLATYGVLPERRQIVVLFHGEATEIILDNETYKARNNGRDNPECRHHPGAETGRRRLSSLRTGRCRPQDRPEDDSAGDRAGSVGPDDAHGTRDARVGENRRISSAIARPNLRGRCMFDRHGGILHNTRAMVRLDERPFTLSTQRSRRISWMLAACLAVSLVPFVLGAHLHAQATTVIDSPCEAGLLKPSSDPLSYKLRGERCEGVYVREVAGTGGFSVVAFVVGGAAPAEAGRALPIEWPSGVNAPVLLRAVSLRRNLYYRMDARRPATSTRFDWPSDVLSELGLKFEEVGIVAWTETRMGESVQDVYVPVRLGGAAASKDQSSYVVQVVSGSDLKDVYVRLSTADASGHEQLVVIHDESLKRGFYPAERAIPIAIPIATLKERGWYRLQLNAISSTGHPSSRVLYFLHGGR
jgi:hypothetical protein